MDILLRALIAFLSVLSAFIPMVAYLLLIWWMDRYVRQPLWMVAGVFIWGAVGAVLLGISASQFFEVPMAQVLGSEATNVIGAIFIAPFVEELSKACILILVALRTDFSSPADGIVFGAATGLGFGMTENFLYFTQVYDHSGFSAWIQNVYVRTFYSAVVHCVCSATFGMMLGFAKSAKPSQNRIAIAAAGILSAMGIHAFWNSSMVLGEKFRSAALINLGFAVLPLLVVVLFVVYQMALFREGRIIRAELNEESQLGTIPAEHIPILISFFGRRQNGYSPAHLSRKQYVELAMRLALKRRQWKDASGFRKDRLDTDIQSLRSQIRQTV